jgi:S-adenosylmethionine decarboxylase
MPVGDMGEEWIVDAFGCDPGMLRDAAALRSLTERILGEVDLHALSDGFWHTFAGEGGVTGLVPLRESHLALHTYPEHGVAAFNLYCCRSGCAWAWKQRLQEALGATDVTVRRVERGRQTTVQSSKPLPTVGEVAREE